MISRRQSLVVTALPFSCVVASAILSTISGIGITLFPAKLYVLKMQNIFYKTLQKLTIWQRSQANQFCPISPIFSHFQYQLSYWRHSWPLPWDEFAPIVTFSSTLGDQFEDGKALKSTKWRLKYWFIINEWINKQTILSLDRQIVQFRAEKLFDGRILIGSNRRICDFRRMRCQNVRRCLENKFLQ